MDCVGQYHQAIGRGEHHKGIGQAGNKSMLGYRAGFGVPGYTGFIPSTESLLLPTKEGLAVRQPIDTTPGDLRRTYPMPLKLSSMGDYTSMYMTDFDWSGVTHHGCHRMADAAKLNPGKKGPEGFEPYSTPLYGQSLYKSATCGVHVGDRLITPAKIRCDAGDCGLYPSDARPGLGSVPGTNSYHIDKSDTGYGGRVAQQKRKDDAAEPPATDPNQVYLDKSVSILPKTTYQDNTSMENHRFAHLGEKATRDSRKVKMHPTRGDAAYKQPTPITSFEHAHGRYGVERNTAVPATFDLSVGTSKATNHIPYYGGFVPQSYRNEHAVKHGLAEDTRVTTKNFNLFELKQYNHHLPRAGIYRPENAINDPGAPVPSTQTLKGKEEARVMANLSKMPPVSKEASLTAAMREGFFQDGQVTRSEVGKHNAETYFRKVRPLEGMPRVLYPSKTTELGAMFHK